jgi:hypothetical protein
MRSSQKYATRPHHYTRKNFKNINIKIFPYINNKMFDSKIYYIDSDSDTLFDSDYMDVEKKDTPWLCFLYIIETTLCCGL